MCTAKQSLVHSRPNHRAYGLTQRWCLFITLNMDSRLMRFTSPTHTPGRMFLFDSLYPECEQTWITRHCIVSFFVFFHFLPWSASKCHYDIVNVQNRKFKCLSNFRSWSVWYSFEFCCQVFLDCALLPVYLCLPLWHSESWGWGGKFTENIFRNTHLCRCWFRSVLLPLTAHESPFLYFVVVGIVRSYAFTQIFSL